MSEKNIIELGKPFMCFLYKEHAHAGSFFISLTPLQPEKSDCKETLA